MRINMNIAHTSEPPPRSLLTLWCNMLASEYLVPPMKAMAWLHGDNSREFVVDFLKSQGWKVESYTTPEIELNRGPVSYGYFISDDCENLVAWKLIEQ